MSKFIKARIVKLFYVSKHGEDYWFAGKIHFDGADHQFNGLIDMYPVERVMIEADMHTTQHAKYGLQYIPDDSATCPLIDKTSFVNYLASGLYQNLNRSIVNKLWSDWKQDIWFKLLTDPNAVQKKSGISDDVLSVLVKLAGNRDITGRLVIMFPHLKRRAARAIMRYMVDSDANNKPLGFDVIVKRIQTNPYLVADESNVSLVDIDLVHRHDLNGRLDDPMRLYYILYDSVLSFMKEYGAMYVNTTDTYECYMASKNDRMRYPSYPDLCYGGLLYMMQHRAHLPLPSGFSVGQLCNLLLEFDNHSDLYPGKLQFVSVPVKKDGKLVNERYLYTSDIWQSKQAIESVILQQAKISLFQTRPKLYELRDAKLTYLLKNEYDFSLNDEQSQALHNVFLNKISVITGGPGRGKTHVVSCLVELWERTHGSDTVMCLGPTGRAVKRMRDVVNQVNAQSTTSDSDSSRYTNIQTMARCLVMNGSDLSHYNINEHGIYTNGRGHIKRSDGNNNFSLDDKTLIIVDESSMLEFVTAGNFLTMCQRATIVFVGDVHQLPPIGYGNFFRELLESDAVPVTHLKENMRTSIPELVTYADAIGDGTFDIKHMSWAPHFSWLSENDDMDTQARVVETYKTLMADKNDPADFDDILILSPVHKSPVGVARLNTIIRDDINAACSAPLGVSRNKGFYSCKNGAVCPGFNISIMTNDYGTTGSSQVRVGDRLMNTVNNMEQVLYAYPNDDINEEPYPVGKGIYNGNIGKVVCYFQGKPGSLGSILIRMDDGFYVEIYESDFSDWTLGYVLTVHASQGSEAKHVILALPHSNSFGSVFKPFYSRNMMYVACTRAKKSVTLVGSLDLFDRSVKTVQVDHNRTRLEIDI